MRWLVLGLVVCVLLSGCGRKDGEGGVAFEDLRYAEGDAWTYLVRTEGEEFDMTTRFLGQETRGGDVILTFEVRDLGGRNAGSPGRRDEVVQGTLAVASTRTLYPRFAIEYDPPFSILVPQADHAHTGQVRISSDLGTDAQPIEANVTYLGVETVTVPAGTYEAHHYRAVVTMGGATQTTESWFSAAVKMPVKTVAADRTELLKSADLA